MNSRKWDWKEVDHWRMEIPLRDVSSSVPLHLCLLSVSQLLLRWNTLIHHHHQPALPRCPVSPQTTRSGDSQGLEPLKPGANTHPASKSRSYLSHDQNFLWRSQGTHFWQGCKQICFWEVLSQQGPKDLKMCKIPSPGHHYAGFMLRVFIYLIINP